VLRFAAAKNHRYYQFARGLGTFYRHCVAEGEAVPELGKLYLPIRPELGTRGWNWARTYLACCAEKGHAGDTDPMLGGRPVLANFAHAPTRRAVVRGVGPPSDEEVARSRERAGTVMARQNLVEPAPPAIVCYRPDAVPQS